MATNEEHSTTKLYLLYLFAPCQCYVVEGCELAYKAPSAVIKQRKRGIKDDTKEDLLLQAAISAEKTSNQLASIRTSRQTEQFAKLKEGKIFMISIKLCVYLFKICKAR